MSGRCVLPPTLACARSWKSHRRRISSFTPHAATATLSRILILFLVLLSGGSGPFSLYPGGRGSGFVHAWPYVDCSGTNPILALDRVTAHFDRSNNSIGIQLDGNFTNTYWAQGYSEAATSQWRTSIQTTIMGTQLYRGEGPACDMILGGCPSKPGRGTVKTSFNISQSAPFAELMVTLQIIGSNNQSIVCVAVLLEQTMPEVNTAISVLPLALALLSGTISLVATTIRATVGNGFLGAAAAYGLPAEAISVHTPGLFDIVFYTQFMLMTGQLSINYPSFYSTFTSLFHWSFLQFSDSPLGSGPSNASEVLKYGGSGSVNQLKPLPNNPPNITLPNGNVTYTTSPPSATQKRSLFVDNGPIQDSESLSILLMQEPMVEQERFNPTPAAMPLIYNPALRHRKRQGPGGTTAGSGTTSPSKAVSSPPVRSPSVSQSSSSSSSKSSTKSKTSKITQGGPDQEKTIQPNPNRPIFSKTTGLAPTPSLIIPTRPDVFTNRTGGSIQFNVSRFGVESYAAAIGAYPSDLFLATLINSALAAAGSLVLSGLFLILAWIMAKEKHQKGKTLHHAFNFVTGNLLRVWSIVFTPLALSSMYQLTISGRVVMTIVSAASLLVFSVGATVFFTWRILRASSELLLFEDQGTLLKYGTLYNTLSSEGTLFFLVTLLVRFLWGLSVAMLPSFGVAQVAVLIIVELGYVVVIGVKWPFAESADNKFHLFLGIIRLVITGCLIAYIHDLETSPEVRQLFGYIQMALHLAVFIVIFSLVLWNFIQVIMFWHSRHSDAWKGPVKTYNFEDTMDDTETGWGLSSRGGGSSTHTRGIQGREQDEDDDILNPPRSRRFTVMSYSSMGSSGSSSHHGVRRESMQHAMNAHVPVSYQHESLDDDTFRYGSPAERYRQARRTALAQSAASEGAGSTDDTLMDDGHDTLLPRTSGSGVAAPSRGSVALTLSSTGPLGQTVTAASETSINRANPRASSGSSVRPAPQRDSYANFQRMSHQQPAPLDLRSRRMSDITRDGPYLYTPKHEPDSMANQESNATPETRPGIWAGLRSSLGGLFRFAPRSSKAATGEGAKPKAFEVIRPPRPHFHSDVEASHSGTASNAGDETGSQAGGDRLRELQSIGISRFFQESDRGYEKNRHLFVANPSAMISRTGSLVSTVSGSPAIGATNTSPSSLGPTATAMTARLTRNGSGTAGSIRTLNQALSMRMSGTGSGLGVAIGASTSNNSPLIGSNDQSPGSVKEKRESSLSDRGITATTTTGSISTSGSGLLADRKQAAPSLYAARASGDGSSSIHSTNANNIAEAMLTDAPLLLDNGGILKVSRGPEKKPIQYWHHRASGQAVESSVESLREPVALLPGTSATKTKKDDSLRLAPIATTASPSSVGPATATTATTTSAGLTTRGGSASGASSSVGQHHQSTDPSSPPSVVASTPSTPAGTVASTNTSTPNGQSPTQRHFPHHQYQPRPRQRNSTGSATSRSMGGTSSSVGGGSGSVSGGPLDTPSTPSSPRDSTGSPPSPNPTVVASAGRMHEILGRMFSNRSVRLHDLEQDSDSVMSEETIGTGSTFSADRPLSFVQSPGSAAVVAAGGSGTRSPMALEREETYSEAKTPESAYHHQHQQHHHHQPPPHHDMLEPVMEGSDPESEEAQSARTMEMLVGSRTDSESSKDSERVRAELPLLEIKTTGSTRASIEGSLGNVPPVSGSGQGGQVSRTHSKEGPKPNLASGRVLQHRPSQTMLLSPPSSANSHASPTLSSSTTRPLAQTPLRTPSLSYSTHLSPNSSLSRHSSGASRKLEFIDGSAGTNWMEGPYYGFEPGTNSSMLNRNASIGTVMTTRTEDSYVTALSNPSDEEDYQQLDFGPDEEEEEGEEEGGMRSRPLYASESRQRS